MVISREVGCGHPVLDGDGDAHLLVLRLLALLVHIAWLVALGGLYLKRMTLIKIYKFL